MLCAYGLSAQGRRHAVTKGPSGGAGLCPESTQSGPFLLPGSTVSIDVLVFDHMSEGGGASAITSSRCTWLFQPDF